MVSKEEFKREVWKFAEDINAKPEQIRLRDMKLKKGSCSRKKIITFDKSLLNMDPSLRREAIIHELLHLRYRHHGKLFKAVLKTYLNEEVP